MSPASPAARVARTVERMPPPRAWSSSYDAPAARRENSSTRSPAKHACVWQSTRPGEAQRPWPSISSRCRRAASGRACARPPRSGRPRRARSRRASRRRRERRAAKRGPASGGRRDLSEVPDQQRASRRHGAHDGRRIRTGGRARMHRPPRAPRRSPRPHAARRPFPGPSSARARAAPPPRRCRRRRRPSPRGSSSRSPRRLRGARSPTSRPQRR